MGSSLPPPFLAGTAAATAGGRASPSSPWIARVVYGVACAGFPADPGGRGFRDDPNGNGCRDFADIVLFFNQMDWIEANEPIAAFDLNHNDRIDFADIVALFNEI